MRSRTTRQFRRLLSDLPSNVQRDAKRAYHLFESNPAHPGLQFKKIEGDDDIYSARFSSPEVVDLLDGARTGTGNTVHAPSEVQG